MQRHASFAPLSRDHHGGLMLAQLLKKNAPVYRGLPETTAEKLKYAVAFYHNNLASHFAIEEQMLALTGLQEESFTTLAAEIVAEHRMLQEIFLSLNTAPDSVATMDEAGRLLEQHIRKEERVLFPMLQQQCTAATLDTIASLFA